MSRKACPICGDSKHTVKAGLSRGKQRYKCKTCGEVDENGNAKGRFFTSSNKYISEGFGKRKRDRDFKQWVYGYYQYAKSKRMSLRELAEKINKEKLSRPVTPSTILYLVKRYNRLNEEGRWEEF